MVTEVQVTGSANVITFNPYYEGVVPVKIINYMAYDIEFQQAFEYVCLCLINEQCLCSLNQCLNV